MAVASAEPYASPCTSLQTDNHASTSSLKFLRAGCPSCRPTNSVKALTIKSVWICVCMFSKIFQTDQSRCLEDERGTKERQIIPCIEAVPDCTEQEDTSGAAPSLVDDVTQPDHRGHVPVIEHLLHATAKLQQHQYHSSADKHQLSQRDCVTRYLTCIMLNTEADSKCDKHHRSNVDHCTTNDSGSLYLSLRP